MRWGTNRAPAPTRKSGRVVMVVFAAASGDMSNMSLSVADMLRNIVEALEETKAPLKHVYTTLGGT